MHPSVTPLAAIFRLNTELVGNCLDGLDDTQAGQRPTPDTNSVAFLLAHLVETRHYLAAILRAPLESNLPESFRTARSLDQAGTLPLLTDLIAGWERISAHLAVVIERLDTAQLAEAGPNLPGSDGTVSGGLAFLAQHESYHLGQIALLRRQFGLPAMSYTLAPRT